MTTETDVNQQPTPEARLYRIPEQGMCIGCGLCQSVAGPDRIKVVKTKTGDQRPVVVGALDHETVDRIYAVCPGTRLEGLPQRLIDDDTHIDNVWGAWRRIVLAWAGDPEVRFQGSTAGVLSALASYLLSSKRVDFILHAKASTTTPTFGERHLSFTHADVMDGAGSRYGPTATLIDIQDVLAKNQPFAFIGKPCDISALRNYARHDARVDKLVKYWLTLVCGGFMTPPKMDAFLERHGVEPKSVTRLRYRGFGCPGPTRVETPTGVTELHYLDMWGGDPTTWGLSFRCKICPDAIGEGADIAVADTWPGGSPERDKTDDDPGTNALIVRTAAGEELLEAALGARALVTGHDLAPDDMSHFQLHQLRKKYAAWARFEGLREEGRIVPETRGLRLKELANEMPESYNAFQRNGTRQRVAEGKASEPRPEKQASNDG